MRRSDATDDKAAADAARGTHEFYKIRADTAALIRDKQSNIVAVEADWPDLPETYPAGV